MTTHSLPGSRPCFRKKLRAIVTCDEKIFALTRRRDAVTSGDMTKTLHVYPSKHAWTVKKMGQKPQTFGTKEEAVASAVRSVKKGNGAQIVVHGRDGRILQTRTFGMQRIQEPPKKGHLAHKKIAAAVGKVVLERVDPGRLTRDGTSEK
jgi:hypothetical protein